MTTVMAPIIVAPGEKANLLLAATPNLLSQTKKKQALMSSFFPCGATGSFPQVEQASRS